MIYSISDLEQLSGIQSHTIRIWEQRYKALKPMRTEGNTRFYDEVELKKLLNIVSLNQSGLKISKICALSEAQINDLLNKEIDFITVEDRYKFYVSQLLNHGLAYNEFEFEQILIVCIQKFGIIETYRNIIYPILIRLGLMWRKDDICPAQEHFLSAIIRRKIFTAIDGIPLKAKSNQTWLLFLPEDEDHDIGLLFAQYILKMNGCKVIFLGAKVPLLSVENVIKANEIDHLLFFLTLNKSKKGSQDYLNELNKISKGTKIHLAGNGKIISQLTLNKHTTWFKSLEEFEQNIQQSQHI
jgi:DNA-binding transcriptional MerR regulator